MQFETRVSALIRLGGHLANAALGFIAIWSMTLWFSYGGVFPNFGPRMRFNGALLLLLLAFAQWFAEQRYQKSMAAVCWFIIVFSLATLSQDLFSWNLYLDNIFIFDRTPLGLAFTPGRIAPVSAIAFATLALGIFLFGRGGKQNFVGQVFIVFSGATAVISLGGYGFGAQQLYKVTSQIKMSEFLAIGIVLSCLAVFCSRPDIGLIRIILNRHPSGQFARRMLGAACLFPPLLSFALMVAEDRGQLSNSASAALSAIMTFAFFTAVIWIGAEGMQAAERDVIEEKLRAERASEVKTQFLANMSHEIRTPVGAILGFSAMLKDPQASEAERAKFLQIIERNSETLLRLIDDILDLSKVEADKILVEQTNIALEELVTDLKLSMKLRALEKGIEFDVHLAESVPLAITCDGLRLRQILTNIVGNAIKFTSHGRVDLYLDHRDDQLLFEVVDTGLGIEAADVQKLFKHFSQADQSTTRKFGGSGLGLVLSKRLCQLLGGDLQLVRSKVGEGSTFGGTVRAPIKLFNEPRPIRATVPGVADSARFASKKILIVDDAADNRLLLSRYLKGTGAAILTASDGEAAVRVAMSEPIDLVLMDIQMPILDGHAATRELRRLSFEKPIIALTAHAMKEERERCLNAGCTDYLTKPIQKSTLLAAVDRHLFPGIQDSAEEAPAREGALKR